MRTIALLIVAILQLLPLNTFIVLQCEAQTKKQSATSVKSSAKKTNTKKINSSPKKDEFQLLCSKAELGDVEAQFKIAIHLLPNKDAISEAGLKWLIKAAENGHAAAQWTLRGTYAKGYYGTQKSDRDYVYWVTKLANNTDLENNKSLIAIAQDELGMLYEHGGQGVEKNISESIKWRKKAAFNGNEYAAIALGNFYNYDKTNANKKEAIYWYKKAMDIVWGKNQEEDEFSALRLRELGSIYHPANNVLYTSATTSGNTDTNQSSTSPDLSFSEVYHYTESGRGQSQNTGQWTDPIPSMECVVEFFEDHITVNGIYCKYLRTSGAWKVYEGFSAWGNKTYYHVDGNKNMKKVCDFSSAYGFDTFVYPMSRNGDPTPQGNNVNNGGYVNSNGANNNNSTGSTTQPVRQFKCVYCNGTGRIERNDNAPASFGQTRANKKCNECGKIYDPTVFNHYHVQCGHCGGTGNAK